MQLFNKLGCISEKHDNLTLEHQSLKLNMYHIHPGNKSINKVYMTY